VIDPSQSLEEKGFAIVVGCLTEQMVNRLCAHLSDDQHAQRNLPDVPMVRELAASKAVKPIIDCLLGKESFAVRGILFNKTPDANWKVVWHQDRTIFCFDESVETAWNALRSPIEPFIASLKLPVALFVIPPHGIVNSSDDKGSSTERLDGLLRNLGGPPASDS